MIVPAKKLNVHLINRVGGSDCVRGGKGSEKVGWTMPVVEWYICIAVTRPTIPFGFPPKFTVPRDRLALNASPHAPDRIRLITLSVNH